MTWFKVLNPDYSQKRGRREMFDKSRQRGHVKQAGSITQADA